MALLTVYNVMAMEPVQMMQSVYVQMDTLETDVKFIVPLTMVSFVVVMAHVNQMKFNN